SLWFTLPVAFVRFLDCFASGDSFPAFRRVEMADGSGPGRVTLSGVVLAGLLLVLILASLYLFIAQPYWFPKLASEHGARIDGLFMSVLFVRGFAFVSFPGALRCVCVRSCVNGTEVRVFWDAN